MNRNSSLLESLTLLAVLKRCRDHNRRKRINDSILKKKEDRQKKVNKLILQKNLKKKINESIQKGVHRKSLTDYEIFNNSDNKEEKDYSSISNKNSSNDSDSNCDSTSGERTKQKSRLITTYSFDKQTKSLTKTLISDDNKEFDKVKDLTFRTTSRRVICYICGKTFSEKNLQFHINKHSNNYPFECTLDNCKRAFTSAQMLKQHQKFHCKIKHFKCESCNQSFHMPNSLKKHRLLHLEPTIKCQECGKMLRTKDALKDHQDKIHLGIKQYSCNICDKRYTNHSSLRKHLMAIHDHKFTSQRIVKR